MPVSFYTDWLEWFHGERKCSPYSRGNPMVSEAEMKEFFQRVVDEVAQLSTQASQVEGLRQHVQSLLERVSALEHNNQLLVSELADARNTQAKVEQEAASFRNQLESERNAVQALRETIYQRDTHVQELTTKHQQETDAHKITTSERDDARQAIQELQAQLNNTHSTLVDVTADRNTWRDKAIDLEAKVSDLNQRLDRVNSILNPIRAVPSADVA